MIIHLTGGDTYRSAKRLAELRVAFISKHDPRGLSVVNIDGATATIAELKSAVTAAGMFATKRFVALDYYQPDGLLGLEVLTGVIEKVADKDSAVIIVVRDTIDDAAQPVKRARGKKPTKKIASNSYVIVGEKREVFSRFTPVQTAAWIASEAKQQGGLVEPAAAQRLAVLCEGDSWRMATELAKLLAYAAGRSVTVADVETMVPSVNASDIFALTDALGQRQTARALDYLHRELAAGVNEFALIATLAGHLRNLYRVKQARAGGTAPSAIAAQLGLHPFVAQKAVAQSALFQATELVLLHHRLLTIDHDLKTSPLDAETLLDAMLVGR